jgi:hypothetical protein
MVILTINNFIVPEHWENGKLVSICCRGKFVGFGLFARRIENGAVFKLGNEVAKPFRKRKLLFGYYILFHLEIT